MENPGEPKLTKDGSTTRLVGKAVKVPTVKLHCNVLVMGGGVELSAKVRLTVCDEPGAKYAEEDGIYRIVVCGGAWVRTVGTMGEPSSLSTMVFVSTWVA